jgi:hypothetical protein
MPQPRRSAAAGGVLALLLIGLGPAQAVVPAQAVAPTWHDLFPRLPRDLAARAEGPAVTDGRYLPNQLRPGVYMTLTTPPGRCRMKPELTGEAEEGPKLTMRSSGPEPLGPKYFTVNNGSAEDIIAAYVFSGGCRWRWVGSAKDAQQWFSEYVGR